MIEAWLISLASHDYLRWLIISLLVLVTCISVCHAIIYKYEPRAAVGWVALILSAPIIGTLIYILLGFNRIKRKGEKLNSLVKDWDAIDNESIVTLMSEDNDILRPLINTGDALGFSPLSRVEDVIPLDTGDEAYPKMLESIESAKIEIKLFSYIFHWDSVGQKFVEALEHAKKRGVKVYILVDGVGSQSTLLKLRKELSSKKLNYEVFLPIIWRPWFVNLRNHRKILIIDGEIAFTGGLNIAEVYWPKLSKAEKILDFHFYFKGTIASYIEQVFDDDWFFCTGKQIAKVSNQNELSNVLHAKHFARVIASGPGEGREKIQWHFISALNNAKKNIRIVTPYFLPSTAVISALVAASNRGVKVDIIVPSFSDHALITWAMNASMFEIISNNCHLWLSAPPFDHSKMLVVDEYYCSVGSANWDVRSLRLNFEMNVEVVGRELCQKLICAFEAKKQVSKEYTLAENANRNLLAKIRDGIARMLSPYL